MIDLHCHLLPGIDDGPADLATTLAMARIAVDDGIGTIFCTPHIYPGLYENTGADITRRVDQLRLILQRENIPLQLSYGADTHLVPEVLDGLKTGRIPTLGGSRYLLLEPSHNVRPPRFTESVFSLVGAGYVPVITHPERLTWAADHMNDFFTLAKAGAWMQITGGALVGRFGPRVQKLADRFVAEGWTAVLASDAHTTNRRAPQLAEAVRRAATLVGEDEARRMVFERPQAVVHDAAPDSVAMPLALRTGPRATTGKILGRAVGWLRKS
jgi:protein-tyrosine phosphatase